MTVDYMFEDPVKIKKDGKVQYNFRYRPGVCKFCGFGAKPIPLPVPEHNKNGTIFCIKTSQIQFRYSDVCGRVDCRMKAGLYPHEGLKPLEKTGDPNHWATREKVLSIASRHAQMRLAERGKKKKAES